LPSLRGVGSGSHASVCRIHAERDAGSHIVAPAEDERTCASTPMVGLASSATNPDAFSYVQLPDVETTTVFVPSSIGTTAIGSPISTGTSIGVILHSSSAVAYSYTPMESTATKRPPSANTMLSIGGLCTTENCS